MEIGKQIKTLRLSKGVTQEELAEYLGVSFQAVSKWETESSTPDIALLPSIAVFFGITIDELFHIPNEAEFERIENMFWHERRINPETWQAYCCRADRLKKLGRYEEALADYEKCFNIQKPPRITDGLHSLAQLHEHLGDYAAAISDRERIIQCLNDEYNTVSGEGINGQRREIERLKGLLANNQL